MIDFIQLSSGFHFVILAIISALFGAISTIYGKVITKDLEARDIMAINFMSICVLLSLLSPFFYKFVPSYLSISLVFSIGLIDTIANYYYFKVFKNTSIESVSPMIATAPFFTFITSWLFLNDTITLKLFLISIFVTLLIILFSLDFHNIKSKNNLAVAYALASAFLFGVSIVPAKYLLAGEVITNAPTLYMLRSGLIAIFAILFFNFQMPQLLSAQYKHILIRSLLVMVQWLTLYYALVNGNAGMIITLASITPVFIFVYNSVVLKQNYTPKQIVASLFVLALAFAIIINYFLNNV